MMAPFRHCVLIALTTTLLISSITAENVEEIRKKCQSVEGLKSCGLCVKQHPDCVWCSDTDLKVPRCDHKTAFERTCPSAAANAGASALNIPTQHNFPLDFIHPQSNLKVQIEPQQAFLKLKPGDVLRVEFTYKHLKPAVEVRDFSIQTSDVQSIGLGVKFEIDCKGKTVVGNICHGIKEGDIIKFYANVTLNECKAGGSLAASIGVYGYNMVSALYVTPLCACECEKVQNQRRNDYACNAAGTLVCGQCSCEKGFGGRKCECDLAKYGVSSPEELDNKCKTSPDQVPCNGKGTCECGKCKCNANYIQGKYCECDSTACPKDTSGRLCSGRGVCDCGQCKCEDGFTGPECGCSSDEAPCRENGKICSDNGKCACGKCACKDGFTGAFCSVAQDSDAKAGQSLNEAEFAEHDDEILPAKVDEEADKPAEKDDDSSSESVEDIEIPPTTADGEAAEEGTAEAATDGAASNSMQTLLSLLVGLLAAKVVLLVL
uniref:INB domain-containing protein n=1 Tax=Panagrellus redivivus TaxID=6233 RepID=A0A7E4W9E4_PANRE